MTTKKEIVFYKDSDLDQMEKEAKDITEEKAMKELAEFFKHLLNISDWTRYYKNALRFPPAGGSGRDYDDMMHPLKIIPYLIDGKVEKDYDKIPIKSCFEELRSVKEYIKFHIEGDLPSSQDFESRLLFMLDIDGYLGFINSSQYIEVVKKTLQLLKFIKKNAGKIIHLIEKYSDFFPTEQHTLNLDLIEEHWNDLYKKHGIEQRQNYTEWKQLEKERSKPKKELIYKYSWGHEDVPSSKLKIYKLYREGHEYIISFKQKAPTTKLMSNITSKHQIICSNVIDKEDEFLKKREIRLHIKTLFNEAPEKLFHIS